MSQRAVQTSLGALAVVAIGLGVVEFILYKRDALAYPRAITIIAIRPTNNTNAPCEVVNDGFASRMFAKPGDRLTWLVVGECKNLSISIKNLFQPGATEGATANATSGAMMWVDTPPLASVTEYGYDITFGPPIPPPPPASNGDASAQPPRESATATGTVVVPVTQPRPYPPGPVIKLCKDWPCY